MTRLEFLFHEKHVLNDFHQIINLAVRQNLACQNFFFTTDLRLVLRSFRISIHVSNLLFLRKIRIRSRKKVLSIWLKKQKGAIIKVLPLVLYGMAADACILMSKQRHHDLDHHYKRTTWCLLLLMSRTDKFGRIPPPWLEHTSVWSARASKVDRANLKKYPYAYATIRNQGETHSA